MTNTFRCQIDEDKTDRWGKKRLAYDIIDSTGKVFTEGYYTLITFAALSEDARAFIEWLKRQEKADKVLRSLVIRKSND